jgi:hypothetical protein
MEWYWVSLHYATFGLGSAGGYIKRAPPIARWAIGNRTEYVLNFYRKKGAKVVSLASRI